MRISSVLMLKCHEHSPIDCQSMVPPAKPAQNAGYVSFCFRLARWARKRETMNPVIMYASLIGLGSTISPSSMCGGMTGVISFPMAKNK